MCIFLLHNSGAKLVLYIKLPGEKSIYFKCSGRRQYLESWLIWPLFWLNWLREGNISNCCSLRNVPPDSTWLCNFHWSLLSLGQSVFHDYPVKSNGTIKSLPPVIHLLPSPWFVVKITFIITQPTCVVAYLCSHVMRYKLHTDRFCQLCSLLCLQPLE